MDNFQGQGFDLSPELLDQIQGNIEEIIKSFPISESNKKDVLKKINFMYSQTRYMSVTDALTGIFNRRHFETTLDREFLRAKRYSSDLSLAIFDIDYFKKINDTYGHLCGDYVLKEIAYIALETFRKTDIIFRYGGEEFVVILTETPIDKAIIPLERFRKAIESYPFFYDNKGFKVTVSIGVETLNPEIYVSSDLFSNADKALYKAKQDGRNRIVTSLNL